MEKNMDKGMEATVFLGLRETGAEIAEEWLSFIYDRKCKKLPDLTWSRIAGSRSNWYLSCC